MSDQEHPTPAEHFHDSLTEIIATGTGAREPLQLGLVPVRWKDTGATSWIVARANVDAPRDADGRGRMEPLALMMDEELIARLDFGEGVAPPERVGDDERSQKATRADFGLPVEPDDAALTHETIRGAKLEVAQLIEALIQGNEPVKVLTATVDKDTGEMKLSPAAAWPWPTDTGTKQ